MNRDALLATIIGFGVGLLIMGGILVGPKLVQNIPKISLPNISFTLPKRAPKETPVSQITPTGAAFTIDAPLAEILVSSSEILVSGTSRDADLVVVQGPGGEAVVIPNGEKKYSATIELVEGRNDIVVTAYRGGMPQELTVTAYYTSENLE